MIDDELEKTLADCREHFFPMNLPEDIKARCVSPDALYKVFNAHVNNVFPRGSFDSSSLSQGLKDRVRQLASLKDRYRLLHHEYILFFNKADQPVGWMFGETQDKISFYMRNTALLKDYQGKGIYTSFLKEFIEYIKSIGYEKIISHHLGTNKAVLIPKLKSGFDICGLELHEILGANVKLVCMLHEDRKNTYDNKFG